ncbi:MAG TPA: hypothetical protein VN767_10975 [Streptosporangiaceae bacterium]|nr:hypothetical protein [Streptosporangiaceae bacterium]
MTNEVIELLDALHDGTVTLEHVAQRFRDRRWPRRSLQEHASYKEMAAAELSDPEPYIPGSYDDVAAAYHAKKISPDQFRVLSKAVADAQSSEDEARGPRQ